MTNRRPTAALLVVLLLLVALAAQAASAPAPHRRPSPRRPARSAAMAPTDSVPVPAVAIEQRPALYLTWHAPFGQPGATTETPAVCGDTLHTDSLFIVFVPTADDTSFTGIAGDIDVYAQGADTLGSFWDMAGNGVNHLGMSIQFAPHQDFPGEQPWNRGGMASVRFERTRTTARLRFFNVVPTAQGIAVRAGHRYTAGCILLRQVTRDVTGCDRPVCFEWGASDFAFAGKPDVNQHGSEMAARGVPGTACRHHLPIWRPIPGARPATRDTPKGR